MHSECCEKDQDILRIRTLGQFVVSKGNKIFTEESSRSTRLWDLFKLFLCNRKKVLVPEVVLETLWSEHEYLDPKHALRSMVYRLRQILEDRSNLVDEKSFINFKQGGYSWNITSLYCLDVEEFEDLIKQARYVAKENNKLAIEIYHNALELYQGDFLAESSYQEWLIPIRSYYRRIFLQSSLDLLCLLKNEEEYQEIIELCEKVFLIEVFEDEVHHYYINALFTLGRIKKAKEHYEYIVNLYTKEIGIKPFFAKHEFKEMLVKNNFENSLELLANDTCLKKVEHNGVFLCKQNIFNFFYKLELQRSNRQQKKSFLVSFNLLKEEKGDLIKDENMEVKALQEILFRNLRRGDVMCCFNERNIRVILNNLSYKQARNVLRRIENKFHEIYQPKKTKLLIDINPIIAK